VPTWTPWLRHWTRTEARRRAPLWLAPAAASAGFAAGATDRGRLKEIAQAAVMGRRVDAARVARAAAAFAPALPVYAGALEAMAADRAQGFTVVLATASARYYVEALAARWPVDDVIATENLREGGHILARLAGPNCYGEAKLARVREWLAARGVDRAACTVRAYSDHFSDLPLLEWADEAVAVAPHQPLFRAAEARGWQVRRWLG
jgi:HAD superfamily hydrolase (TIGR01490 family)